MKLAAYTRVSRVGDRQDTLQSPDYQAETITRWAQAAGHEVTMLPPELDASGGDNDRPILGTAIERVEVGELDGIVVAKLDRFSRSLPGAVAMIERIEKAGGQVLSVAENFDTSTATGRKVRQDFINTAEWERGVKAEGFEVVKADAIARAVWTAPRVPLGYLKNGERRLEPDPLAAPVVARAFEMRSQGASWREIAEMIGNALDRPFYGPTVSRMIASRTYLGEARQGKYVNLTAHPPLVDLTLWQAAQRQMPRPARGRHPVALLGGLIRCAGCSRRMSSTFTTKRGRVYRQYRCRVHGAGGMCPEPAAINAPLIEPLVAEAVLTRIEDLTATASERNRRVEDAEREVTAAEAELAAFVASTRALSNQEAFRTGAEARSQAVDEAKVRLAGARLQAPQVPAPERVRSLWPKLSEDERNHVLRASLDLVWVKRGRGAGRVRLIAAGHGPAGLSRQGKVFDPVAAPWPKGDLPGEVGVPCPEDAK
jgi:site-specific DNA recombinase